MEFLIKLVKYILGDTQEKILKPYYPVVTQINHFENVTASLSDEELRNKTFHFKERLGNGEPLESILPEAFAVVREAARRSIGLRHFDVQLLGGIALHQGKIAEMKTGEGKTVVATLPAYLNALEGKGVYIVTVNDYLARRDHGWMGKIYEFLGLSCGLIQTNMNIQDRLHAYSCDITYGTNNEFGFDYLRDNLAHDIQHYCQRRRHYAIVDEVDSILIDEARTPLIISGPVEGSIDKYSRVAKAINSLKKEEHFTCDEKHRNVVLTEEGIEKCEKVLGISNIYSVKTMEFAHMAVQCLKAKYLFKRDVDYVIKNNEVLIVDEFTGRILEGRRYSDGLHQAIEAVEGIPIREESQTLASITFQNYFRMFPKLAGMTGTAATEAPEFLKIYGLEVVSIPTHKVMIRNDLPDVVYKTRQEKYKAVIQEIKKLYTKGQPVLVGTISIETSEHLSSLLKRENIPHSVLNAKYHEKEAEIIAQAGQKGTVTIATNMAGRGTDIVLGEAISDLGGLFVLGTERHESRRIDNQLRGRSGRQGDPGKSRFYVSLEDDLMRLFGSERIARVMDRLGIPADTPIEHALITRSIEKAQSKVEQYHFGIRKQILQYDDVLNRQREMVYGIRHHILEKKELYKSIKEWLTTLIHNTFKNFMGEMDFKTFKRDKEKWEECKTWLNHFGSFPGIEESLNMDTTALDIQDRIVDCFYNYYSLRKTQFPEGLFEEVTKRVLISTLDRKWMDHLHNMDVLREGIGLRAWGQRDPLMEYKIEAFQMFADLLLSTWEEAFEIMI